MSDRLDLGGHQQPKKQQQANIVDWSTTSRINELDAIFKAVVHTQKEKENSSRSYVSQRGTMIQQLTNQQISECLEPMEIIQQDVSNGIYDDPNKPYYGMNRLVEDRYPVTNTNLKSRSGRSRRP